MCTIFGIFQFMHRIRSFSAFDLFRSQLILLFLFFVSVQLQPHRKYHQMHQQCEMKDTNHTINEKQKKNK